MDQKEQRVIKQATKIVRLVLSVQIEERNQLGLDQERVWVKLGKGEAAAFLVMVKENLKILPPQYLVAAELLLSACKHDVMLLILREKAKKASSQFHFLSGDCLISLPHFRAQSFLPDKSLLTVSTCSLPVLSIMSPSHYSNKMLYVSVSKDLSHVANSVDHFYLSVYF